MKPTKQANLDPEASPSSDSALYQAWRDASGYQGEITEDDTVFDLGGDSLDIVNFAVELTQALDKQVDYYDIYEQATFADLMTCLEDKPVITTLTSKDESSAPLTAYTLSRQQQRYQHIYLPHQNSNWCNMQAVWEFPSESLPLLAPAFITLIERHDILRSYRVDDQMQLIPSETITTDFIDYLPCTDEAIATTVDTERLKVAANLIDLSHWPLFSAKIIHSPTRVMLIWTIHHLICDGHSQGVIQDELKRLTQALPLDAPAGSYARYAMTQAPVTETCRHYWESLYATPYHKIILSERYPEYGAQGHEYVFALTTGQTQRLRNQARTLACTPFSILLTAYFASLHDQFRTPDMVVGTPALGRMTRQEEAMVGNFISLVTIRSQLAPGQPLGSPQDIKRIHTGIYKAMKHQDYQFDRLVQHQGGAFEQDRFPFTTFFISLLNKKSESWISDRMDYSRPLGSQVKFDMMLYIDDYQDCFVLRSQYRRALWTHEEQQTFWSYYVHELERILHS